MAGGLYVVVAISFGLAGGIVAKLKGSSFWVWFLVSLVLPVLGLLGALLYRVEDEEPRQRCPSCGRICMAYDALCTRCGRELEFNDGTELLIPHSGHS